VKSKYAGTGLVELHLVRPLSIARSARWHASLELMLYPGRFTVALLHAALPSSPGARVPFGFISTRAKHLRVVHQLMLDAGDGNRYAGRWSPGRDSAPSRPRRYSMHAPSWRTQTFRCRPLHDTSLMNLKSKLAEMLQAAAKVNRNLMTAPAAVLWPDSDRQWQKVVPCFVTCSRSVDAGGL